MSLNYSEQRQLHRIESRLLRSDPHLAAMLTVFARLSAGQRMPAREQVATRLDRMRQAAPLTAKAISVMVAAIGLLVSAILILPGLIMESRIAGGRVVGGRIAGGRIVGGRARAPQPTRKQPQTGPGTNGR